MTNHPDQLIKGKERVALYLCSHVLSLCTEGKEFNEVEVVGEFSSLVSLFHFHQLEEIREWMIIIEQEDIITSIGQLRVRREDIISW